MTNDSRSVPIMLMLLNASSFLVMGGMDFSHYRGRGHFPIIRNEEAANNINMMGAELQPLVINQLPRVLWRSSVAKHNAGYVAQCSTLLGFACSR